MSRPDQCANCAKPTTIHLTQIVDGKILKLDICEDCVFKDQVVDPIGFSLAELLAAKGLPQPEASDDEELIEETCPSCGSKPSDLQETRRFGCPQCYETFSPILEETLSGIQYGQQHTGKEPRRPGLRAAVQAYRQQLTASMEAAIAEERYEDAARYRDKIRKMEGL